MTDWVCDGLNFFWGAEGGLLCARGRRASRCGRSDGPAFRDWWILPLKQSTTRHKFVLWFAPVSWNMPRRVGQTPQVESRNRTKKSKKTSVEFRVFTFPLKMPSWFFTFRPIKCKLNWMKKCFFELEKHKRPRQDGFLSALQQIGIFVIFRHSYAVLPHCWATLPYSDRYTQPNSDVIIWYDGVTYDVLHDTYHWDSLYHVLRGWLRTTAVRRTG